jgi:hypothetical protein
MPRVTGWRRELGLALAVKCAPKEEKSNEYLRAMGRGGALLPFHSISVPPLFAHRRRPLSLRRRSRGLAGVEVVFASRRGEGVEKGWPRGWLLGSCCEWQTAAVAESVRRLERCLRAHGDAPPLLPRLET